MINTVTAQNFTPKAGAVTSGQLGPKSAPLSQKDRYKRRARSEADPHSLQPADTPQAPGNPTEAQSSPHSRLRFEIEGGPGSLLFNEETPATSGQVGPKS